MPITADRRLIKRLLSKHGEEASRQLIELHRADTLGQSSICIPRLATFETANAMIDELLQEEKCFSLKDLAVNGNDMMAIGLKGKSIGNALQACLDAVMDERVANDHTALLTLAQEQMIADTDQIILLKEYDPEIIRNFVERVRVYPSGEIEIDMRTSSGFEFVTAS